MKYLRCSQYLGSAAPLVLGMALLATPAGAQDVVEAAVETQTGGDIVVTGSRIARPNLTSNSPVAVVTGEAVTSNADITLDTFLNTLPQVNPAGTSTSNNPPNGGQSNIDLRGMGPNRNLVLINGRRPMVSASDQTVDLNTIPQGLIERVDVTTGGAGGAYGADAIAGVVNLVLKRDFEGLDLRASYSNALKQMDAREYQISGVIGGNFAEGRGNIAFSAEYSKRQGLIKAQRPFAAQATATTGSAPTGTLVNSSGNPFNQTAVDTLFAGYGVAADQSPRTNQLAFNSDGSLFGVGTFNSPVNVANFRYPLSSAANPNLNFFPDFYSYNFDIVNILTLPLERKSAFMTARYEISPAAEIFTQAGFTEYQSSTALAPTPIGTRIVNSSDPDARVSDALSPLVEPGRFINNLVVPITNPFISDDLAGLLAGRTGDDESLTGSGATEAFRIGYRFLGTGLRESVIDNEVLQGLIGLRGEIAEGWNYEAYYSYGRTTIDTKATGNVNVQKVQTLLEAADGGASICAGGFNPFGIQPLSAECVAYVAETGQTRTRFTQNIAQAFVTGELAELPGGPVGIVLGVESRKFKYDFDPGALFGPIAGFNTATVDRGTNSFFDIFGELRAPITDTAEISFTARHSRSDFNDIVNDVDGDPVNSWAYGVNASWAPIPDVRLRGSYQRSVRAPNFGELFSGGGSFPQIFDPCSVNTNFRQNGGAAAADLCEATGVEAGNLGTYVATPGAQLFLGGSGNTDLKPEKADTFTVGFTFNVSGLVGSVDYYNIRVKDTIYNPDVNEIIASCYGYNDINPDLDDANPFCAALVRTNNNFSSVDLPTELGGDADGNFRAVNQGTVKTSGLDFQLGYRLPTEFIDEASALNLNLLVNHLLDYKVGGLGGLTTDYAGTASFFGAGLGATFPKWRGTLNAKLNFTDELALDSRVRYIGSMENRASRIYAGEEFTAPGSVWYFDFALQAEVEAMTFRIGLNNAFNRQPPTYSPNVQSGTDPSVYDVIGRRGYVSARLRF